MEFSVYLIIVGALLGATFGVEITKKLRKIDTATGDVFARHECYPNRLFTGTGLLSTSNTAISLGGRSPALWRSRVSG